MANLKLEMNQVSIDTSGAKARVLLLVKDALNQVAEQMGKLIQREIARNGNGSSAMKQDAISLVKAIMKEANYERVIVESGIDETMLSNLANDFRVRVLVVLHGNMASGPIVTKPGQQTFAKGVKGPRLSPLTGKRGYDGPNPRVKHLDFFEQDYDMTDGAIQNIEKEIEPIFKDACERIIYEISSAEFWEPFIRIS